MKKIFSLYMSVPLVGRIGLGLGIGILLGFLLPGITLISLFGTLFTGSLKAVAPILVFMLVISSLSRAGEGIGKRFLTVIFLYGISTFLAAVAGVFVSFIFRVEVPLYTTTEVIPPEGLGEVLLSLLNSVIINPVEAIATANYPGVLFWAIIFGLCLRLCAPKETLNVISHLSEAVSRAVSWIVSLAPLGVLGLVYNTLSEQGSAIFIRYGALLLLLTGCMLFVALVTNPLVLWFTLGKNPYPLVFRCLKESGITAFFTRSSAANIPVNMRLCQNLGLDSKYYSVAIPLGATVNMNGAAVTITVMSLGAAFALNIEVNILVALVMCFASTLGACGASGVAGGSLLLIPMACSFLGIDSQTAMQVVGTGFVIGVVQDSFETALNSSGDVLFCAAAEFRQWKKQGKKLPF